jgi:hypothetical protein
MLGHRSSPQNGGGAFSAPPLAVEDRLKRDQMQMVFSGGKPLKLTDE